MNDEQPVDPRSEIARIEGIAIAATWSCRHCSGRATLIPSNSRVVPWDIEHVHEVGCPDHDDQLEAAVLDAREVTE